MAFHPSHVNTGAGEVTETGFAAAACSHSLGFTVQSNGSVEMFVPGPASTDGVWQRVRVTAATLEAPEHWLAVYSGSTWGVTCCVDLLPGERRRGNSITRGKHCFFWELGWGVFACVGVFFSQNPTAYLACFSVSPLPSGQNRLCNSLLFPAWPDVFSC